MNDLRRIYLDNAATSWPKPESVYLAVELAMRSLGAPAGRGAYREAAEVERRVAHARRRVADLLELADSRRIVFTSNGTDSLNLALHGLLKPGDHVVTSVVEHNSTLRPLRHLERHRGVAVDIVGCDSHGVVDPDAVRSAMRANTKLVALVHASNVTGAIQPIDEVGRLVRERDALFLVDAAQSLGQWSLSVSRSPIDLLAAPGHKGLLGPLGTGLLYVGERAEPVLDSVRQGGTGTRSEDDFQPETLPDKFESGNHNVPGLFGLEAGVAELAGEGVARVRRHHRELTAMLLDRLGAMPEVTLYGPRDADRQVGVVGFQVNGYDPQELAAILDASYGVQGRAGFHCASRMHQALGTHDAGGTMRLSVGPFTTVADVATALRAIEELAGDSV